MSMLRILAGFILINCLVMICYLIGYNKKPKKKKGKKENEEK